MKTDSPDNLLRRYYADQRLPRESVEAIRNAIDETSDAESALHSRPRRLSPWLAAAASVLLTLLAVLAYEIRGGSLFDLIVGEPAVTRNPSLPEPDIIVIKFSADWCPTSAALAPNFTALRDQYDADEVLFIELDLTDKARSQQAKLLVSALGIQEIWAEQDGATGEMLYVDAKTRRVIRTFDHEDLYDEMSVVLDDALDSGRVES